SRPLLTGEESAGAHLDGRVAQAGERACLDLAYPLATEVDELADFVGGARLAAVEPESEREDVALPLVEHREELLDLGGQHRTGRGVERRLGTAVLHQVPELGLAVLADGGFE